MNTSVPTQIPLLDLDLLRTVSAIAETGSFSGAARIVFRTPSAISMQVKKVEEILGRSVFVRDSRSVTLTADGQVVLEHARRMLALNRELLARFITPEIAGTVRLGAPDDVAERFLPEMLRRFYDTHPSVSVDVEIVGSGAARQMLSAGQLDLAIINCGIGAKAAPGIETLRKQQLVWGMLRGGVAPECTPLPVSVWEEGCAWRDVALAGLEAQGRPWRLALRSGHIAGQRAAILSDLAIAPIPDTTLDANIVEVPGQFGLPILPGYVIGLMQAEDVVAPAKAAADHLRAAFANV